MKDNWNYSTKMLLLLRKVKEKKKRLITNFTVITMKNELNTSVTGYHHYYINNKSFLEL